jgi:hypothetical protein
MHYIRHYAHGPGILPHAISRSTLHAPWGARQDPTRLWPLGISGCPGAAGRLRVLRGVALGSDGQPRVVPGLHAPSEDGDHRKVVIP